MHDGNHNNVVNQRFYLHVNAKGSRQRRPAGVRATKDLGREARRFSANLTSFRAGNRSSTHPIVTEVALAVVVETAATATTTLSTTKSSPRLKSRIIS